MKAWVLDSVAELKLKDVPIPQTRAGEVLVRVKAAGICQSDMARVFHAGAYRYPLIPGHEFSGVTACGRRVGVFPLLPCHACDSCAAGRYETCVDYDYLGSRRDGGFAEYVAVPEWNLVALPDEMTFSQAALLEPAAVALHAVRRLDLSDVRSVAVVGNGIIGRLVARWLFIKHGLVADVLGHDDVATPGYYDACFEAVGKADALSRAIDLARPGGQLVLIGNPGMDFRLGRETYWQILRKQLDVKGSWNSRYPADWQEAVAHAAALRLDSLISHRLGFAELDAAFVSVREKGGRYMKVVVEMD